MQCRPPNPYEQQKKGIPLLTGTLSRILELNEKADAFEEGMRAMKEWMVEHNIVSLWEVVGANPGDLHVSHKVWQKLCEELDDEANP